MNVRRIEFMVTHRCTGACRHCSVGDCRNSADAKTFVRPDKAAETVTRLAEMFDVSSVMTFGGEPLLHPEAVCAVHRAAADAGIPKRQVITNGYFTKNEDRIRTVAESLYSAGVNDLLLSVDAFHQRTIPLETVHRFAEEVTRTGLTKFRLQPAWLVNRAHDNPYNAETERILASFSDLGLAENEGNDIFMAGDAVRNFAEYYPAPCLDLSDTCGSMPYTEPLDHVTNLSVNPNGDAVVCGFVIGNIYREPVGEIVRRYNPYENECMRTILTDGAAGLLKLAAEKGIAVDTRDCYSVCDLCRRVCGQAGR